MSECLNPFTIKYNTPEETQVPCGKCIACRSRQVSSWSFRLMQHYRQCINAYFITFTYDTTNVPITKNGFMSLCKRDMQLFFKRLRKACYGNKTSSLKYYCVGEYGGNTKRPHFHAIIFNVNLQELQKCWDKGNIHYGTVNEASCGYTLKYMFKKGQIPMHSKDDRIPEFALMSKGLGLVT